MRSSRVRASVSPRVSSSSDMNNRSSSRSSSRSNSRSSNRCSIRSSTGEGLYEWWPWGVKQQQLHPLCSVVWVREKASAWALIDWKVIQMSPSGSLIILDFAHPDASPVCPFACL